MKRKVIRRRTVKTVRSTTDEGKTIRNTKRKWYRKTVGPGGTVIGEDKPDLRNMFK